MIASPCARRVADLAPSLTLAAALPLPFASFPLFALGYWDKAEPMLVWFHATGGLAALAVALALLVHGRLALQRVTHPYVLLPLALGLWSMVTAPWHQLPLLTLMGAPQSGYGALWFLDLAAYCACALLAADRPRHWRRLIWLAVATGVVLAGVKAWDIHTLGTRGTHLLLFVAAYYGWFAMALPLLGLGAGRWQVACFLLVAVALALASLAKSALAAMAVGVAAAALWRWRAPANAMVCRLVAAGLVIAAAILPYVALHAIPLMRKSASLLDRILVQEMLLSALAESPAWLVGHGWGRSQDAFQAWLASAGQRLWRPDWTFLTSDYFHAHTWLLESLHAEGAVGVLLTLAGFAAIPWFAAESRRPVALGFAIAYALLHGLWFQLCLSLPVVALALASVADRSAPTRLPSPRLIAVVAAVMAVGQLTASAALLGYGVDIGRLGAAIEATPPRVVPVPADFRDSDLAAAEMIRDRLASLEAQPDRARLYAPLLVPSLVEFIDRRVDTTPTILLLTVGLDIMARIHVTGELPVIDPAWMALWERWLDRLLTVAPRRTDQAIPYFTTLIAQGRVDRVDGLARRLLAGRADDPVGLYYGGIALLLSGDPARKAAGLSMIRRALQNGLELVMPVDPAVKALF